MEPSVAKLYAFAYFGDMLPPNSRVVTTKSDRRYCAMCLFLTSVENSTVVKLRGLCKSSKFDEQYQVAGTGDAGLIYYGLRRSVIEYNYTMLAWQIRDILDPTISATFKSPYATLAMGSNTWVVVNDAKCQTGEVPLFLSLTSCLSNQFTCGDGICIEMKQRCNGVTDCKDKIDELDCNIAEIDPSYNKELAPPPEKDKAKVMVVVNVTINSLNSFNLIEENFELEFVVSLKWFDSRLVFNNLREKKIFNVMGPKEKGSIWFPSIVLENTKQKLKFLIDSSSVISVERNGEGKPTDSTFTENKLLYQGDKNPLNYERLDNMKLNCLFELSWYPFDTQTCFIIIGQTEISSYYVEQVPGYFAYLGPEDLTKYFVKRSDMKKVAVGGREFVQVQITIGRRLLSILLTTFLPTVILNLIGHTANYFKEFFFEVSTNHCTQMIHHISSAAEWKVFLKITDPLGQTSKTNILTLKTLITSLFIHFISNNSVNC